MTRHAALTIAAVLLPALIASIPASARDHHEAALTLERIMADPDWIGPPVGSAWWQLDGSRALYRVRRPGTERDDLHAVDLVDGGDRVLDPAEQDGLDGARPVLSTDGDRALTIRDGALLLRDLRSGELTHVTAGGTPVQSAHFATDGDVLFRRGGSWHRWSTERRVARPLTNLRLEDDPVPAEPEGLKADQLRYFEVLAEERRETLDARAEAVDAARADVSRAVPPWYLGKGRRIVTSTLSADGRWLLIATEAGKANENGQRDRMPRFVTDSGYVEVEDVRRLVGRDAAKPHQLELLDLATRTRHALDLSALPGVDEDPLAELKAEQEIEAHDADDPRPVRLLGARWHPTQARLAVMLRSVDNKDRWLATLEAGEAPALVIGHRTTDSAWINWRFNEFGWVPGSRELWFLSEETGFGQLYRLDRRGRVRAVTEGPFEVSDVTVERDGEHALALSNRAHPTQSDLYRIRLRDGRMTRLTQQRGVERYALHPLTGDVLLLHSASYVPTQMSLLRAGADTLVALTDTRTPDYRALSWQAPEIVPVPSTHGAGADIWTKFYPARADAPGGGAHPLVVFVHGAGYTQNTHHRFPYYFREQMFHNLLTECGDHVIDMDYRASRGYGRDWRTAIYRQMGTPELEDLLDGIAWAVAEHDADPARVGVYGGSYGGFMTFMAMFNAPEHFAAGASLRPVTDWASYNHGYTSNILNTPQVDPEAYRRSSPIEFAEGLEGDLLIAHGMLDDNVFYKDSVRLVQRLIELEKTDWEFASYPVEPHAFVHASSWLDEYRRVLKLFDETIGSPSN